VTESSPPDGTIAWRTLLREAESQLAAAGIGSAGRDARLIVEQASGYEGAELELSLDRPATRRGVAALDGMVQRRCAGEPLQYVLGSWGFRRLDLLVDRRVLIPRPETEVVVDHALAELDRRRADQPHIELVAADLGTGSGAIAISLVVERTDVEVWATDVSADALAVARVNLAGAGRPGSRVRLVEGSWFAALPAALRGRLDLVVSNPPYVGAGERLPAEVAEWEPASALVAGDSGTEAMEIIVAGAAWWLAPGGALVVELAPHQADTVSRRAVASGLEAVEVHPDLTGRARVLRARRAG
jgi:release factor glutamine methyltransferase